MRNVFSKSLLKAAQKDSRVLLLTGDHGYALFDEFRQHLPAQFINAGIAEQNMVGVAAGLAKVGYKPIVYGLSAFVPIRVLEQIKIDVCYENLPVVFIGDGAGVVYSSLGSSHQSVEDIAVLRCLPNIKILSPCDAAEMDYAMSHALTFSAPLYLRMGKSDIGDVHNKLLTSALGDLISVKQGTDTRIVFFATGSMVKTAMLLAEAGNFSVWSVPSIKPINEAQVSEIARDSKILITLEEHSVNGGLGGLISEIVGESGIGVKIVRFGIKDRFSEKCGSYDYLLKEHGINMDILADKVNFLVDSL